ncbi:MAG: SRPBCC domain-containing protein [Luteimonas sp.]
MPTDAVPIELRVSRHIAAAPERVFDAWLAPGTMACFLFATPGGVMQTVANDPRVGGRFTVVERRAHGDASHYGVWHVLARPTRLVFAFSTERHDPAADAVSITLTPEGDGCLVTLVHTLAPEWADDADRTRGGWTSMLDTLARVLDATDTQSPPGDRT